MMKLLRNLVKSAERIERERIASEVERIRQKAIDHDAKKGQITEGVSLGDRVLISVPKLDSDGLAFNPNDTVNFIVEDEPTALDQERAEQLAQEQHDAETLRADFKRQISETRQWSIREGLGDPYKELVKR